MTVNIDCGNIFELVSEFSCSDGYVAVVDSEERLMGIFGNREYQNLIKDITHGLELDEDYRQHYSIFQEGDTTEDEIYTFQQLQPQKEKKYLNYGCGGAWSRSIRELRNMGYDVYEYTRFHLCFPVGQSSQIMFERAGLQIIEKIKNQFLGDRYLCCILKKRGNNV